MSGAGTFSLLAVLHELNDREFRRRLAMFTEELKYYVILAGGIVGAELSKRVKETPEAVVRDGGAFVMDMMSISAPRADDVFRGVLETTLIETLKYEMRFSCMNCRRFNECIGLDNLGVGALFERRVLGDETPELRNDIAAQVSEALSRTPYLDDEDAEKKCSNFAHQYAAAALGEVFARYSEIAAALQKEYGIDYSSVLQQMVKINMDFCRKSDEQDNR
ncbi:MAG TPA: hypothetical protein VK448_03000 [Dissulfurispiraceae bacterium]|nr:hypothetical protein [Dissulfurispiraceae bacterium]